MTHLQALPRWIATTLLLLALGWWALGCQQTPAAREGVGRNPQPPAGDVASLRPGDTVLVELQGIPDPAQFSLQLDDQGRISLRYLGQVEAAGQTASSLAQEIRDLYLERDIYRQINVSVVLAERYVYVGGEVQRPGPVTWSNDLTLTKAITAAGGFGLYAREQGVQLSRDERSYTLDARLAQRTPTEDVRLLPGDTIFVPRSAF
ncbi:MAG: polysaccharide biosynthesis/export family protein [Verrucomicrobiota bacterium JB022]|nr:polysaccharide biosynthesis/export family protein [Verrucomicrobiota bacterium JB022]